MFALIHSTHKHKGNEINLTLTYIMIPHSKGALGFAKQESQMPLSRSWDQILLVLHKAIKYSKYISSLKSHETPITYSEVL